MRILAVIPGSGSGSHMVFARRQVEEACRLGEEVKTFYFEDRKSLLGAPLTAWRLRRTIKRWRPDLVHVHYGSGTAALTALACPGPFVITLRGSDISSLTTFLPWRRAVTRSLSKWAARRAAGVICVSDNLAKDLGAFAKPMAIIPSGVDISVFFPIEQSEARRKLGWRTNERVIAFNAGTDPTVKDLPLALKVFDHVRRAVPSARMHIMDGSVPPGEVPMVLNAADCLLVTSISEGSPTIVQEALACNLPVVSVDVGDVAAVIDGVAPGGIADRDDEALARAVSLILRNPKRSNGTSAVARLSLEYTVRETIQFYNTSLGKP